MTSTTGTTWAVCIAAAVTGFLFQALALGVAMAPAQTGTSVSCYDTSTAASYSYRCVTR